MTLAASTTEGFVAAPAAAGCAHCGATLRDGGRFCCAGCEAAHALIRGSGLDAFYRRRARGDGLLRPSAEQPAVAAFAIVPREGVCAVQLIVDGLVCGACVWLIENVLAREPEIVNARVNLSTRRLTLEWRGAPELADRFARRVAGLGFRLAPFDARVLEDAQARRERELLQSLAVAGFAAASVMLLSVSVWLGHDGSMGEATRALMHWVSALIALPAIVYAGRPFFRSAWAALAAGRTNMDVPISIGVTLAAAMSVYDTATGRPHAFFDSAITLLFFLLIGRYLDQRARGRARGAAQHLLALNARAATVVDAAGATALRRPDQVRPGEIVIVAAGERVPVDGVVRSGRSSVDQSVVSGESLPITVAPGTRVFAGTLNRDVALRIEAQGAGDGTLLAEIVRLMETAERARGRYVGFADRVARLYAPVVHLAAALTFAGWYWLVDVATHDALANALAVLIITCPCALALAVPATQVAACSRLLRQGILVRSGTGLEKLAEIDGVVFDKTGTLTSGRPTLVARDAIAEDALRLAASLAQSSRHPLARALVAAADGGARALDDVVEQSGEGMSWRGPAGEVRLGSRAFCGVAAEFDVADARPEIWLARPGKAPLRFSFDDAPRADAAATIAALASRGLRAELLSGDRPDTVRRIAEEVGVRTWRARCDPAAKAAHLAALARSSRRVAMVGDGLNDGPALAAAHVSLSPATASDVALNGADFVFQGERLGAVVEALDVARATRRVAIENLALALVYNLLAVPLAVLGHVTPLVAAVAMSSSSLIVIANAARLSRGGKPWTAS